MLRRNEQPYLHFSIAGEFLTRISAQRGETTEMGSNVPQLGYAKVNVYHFQKKNRKLRGQADDRVRGCEVRIP